MSELFSLFSDPEYLPVIFMLAVLIIMPLFILVWVWGKMKRS